VKQVAERKKLERAPAAAAAPAASTRATALTTEPLGPRYAPKGHYGAGEPTKADRRAQMKHDSHLKRRGSASAVRSPPALLCCCVSRRWLTPRNAVRQAAAAAPPAKKASPGPFDRNDPAQRRMMDRDVEEMAAAVAGNPNRGNTQRRQTLELAAERYPDTFSPATSAAVANDPGHQVGAHLKESFTELIEGRDGGARLPAGPCV
jgi:hypothetical protein